MRKAKASLQRAVVVELSPARRRRDGRHLTVQAARDFMRWSIDNEVFPIRGTCSSSNDFYFGAFPLEHEPAILKWLEENDLGDGGINDK